MLKFSRSYAAGCSALACLCLLVVLTVGCSGTSSAGAEATGSITLVEATPTIGESTRAAVEEANVFLLSAPSDSVPDESDPWAKRMVGGIAHRFGWSHADDGSDGSDAEPTDE